MVVGNFGNVEGRDEYVIVQGGFESYDQSAPCLVFGHNLPLS